MATLWREIWDTGAKSGEIWDTHLFDRDRAIKNAEIWGTHLFGRFSQNEVQQSFDASGIKLGQRVLHPKFGDTHLFDRGVAVKLRPLFVRRRYLIT